MGANSDPCVTFLVAVITSCDGSYNLQSLTFELILMSKQAATVDVCSLFRWSVRIRLIWEKHPL